MCFSIPRAMVVIAGLSLLQPTSCRLVNAEPPGDEPPAVLEDGTVVTSGKMRIRVLDPEGRPLPGVTVEAKRVPRTTSADGIAEITFPKRMQLLRVWVRKEHYVPLFLQWWPKHQPDGHLVPEEYTVTLMKGTVIGGFVKNEAGEPIEGVTVEVKYDSKDSEVLQRPRFDSWLATGKGGENPARTTDAEGRWTLDNVPPGKNVEVEVKLSHPDYINDDSWGGLQRDQLVTMTSLRDQTAAIVMQRGVSVTGRVNDPDGNPVAGAVVVWGKINWSIDGREVLTNKQGVYRLPALPLGPTDLTVVAKGWKPEQRKIDIQPDMMPIDFALQKGRQLGIRFVNPAGDPVQNVLVYLERWGAIRDLGGNSNSIYRRMPRLSDADGRFIWDSAPEEPVTYKLRTEGYANLDVTITADGNEHVVTLDPIMNVSGSVVDAGTGEYVDGFQAVPVIFFHPDFLFVNRRDAVDGHDGRFEIEFERTDIEHGVRIEAEGYRTQLAGPWKIGDPNPVIDFKLEPADPISGVVVDESGQPVAGARVYLSTHTQHLDIQNHTPEQTFSNNWIRQSDVDGRFTFPAQYEPYALVVIHDAGYVDALLSPEEQPETLRLERWARIEGRLLQGDDPVAGQRVLLEPLRPRSFPLPRIDERFAETTDQDGRFAFERVPPVKCSLTGYLTVWDEFPFSSSQLVPLDLQPGDDLTIDLNGEGATVTGRVVLAGETQQEIDLNYSLNYLLALREGIEPPPSLAETGFDWKDGWSDAWTSTDEGRSYKDTLHHYFVKLNRDGTFRISGVPPGDYELALKLYAPPEEGCLVQPIATHQLRFEVAPSEVTSGLNVGDIPVKAFLGPQPGEPAPDFTFETLDGAQQSLSDLRGRYVLIDFWATWCGPCLAKLPEVRELHHEFAGGGELVVLGINLDSDLDKAKEFVKRQELSWRHGFLGDWSDSTVPVQYGINSVPAYLLIDPAGKLNHRGYRTDELRAAVQEAVTGDSR